MGTKPRILIVEDELAFARLLAQRCADFGLEPEIAPDGLGAIAAALKNPPDLFILDLKLPDTNGLAVCEKIVEDDRLKSVPVIVLTGSSDDALIRRCEALGANYCYKGLEVWQELKPLIGRLLAWDGAAATPPSPGARIRRLPASGGAPPKILVIDDDPDVTRAMSIRLGALGIAVTEATDASGAKLLALQERPDVIITDFHMPGRTGERLLLDLKEDPDTRRIPVIVVTGDKVDGQPNYALKREFLGRWGAAAYFSKPLDFHALVAELKRHVVLRQPAAAASS